MDVREGCLATEKDTLGVLLFPSMSCWFRHVSSGSIVYKAWPGTDIQEHRVFHMLRLVVSFVIY